MIKQCPTCRDEFPTSDSRRVCCSRDCANLHRSEVQLKSGVSQTPLFESGYIEESFMPACTVTPILPDPDTLPAAYVKRVHDLWVSLTEDGPKRIA